MNTHGAIDDCDESYTREAQVLYLSSTSPILVEYKSYTREAQVLYLWGTSPILVEYKSYTRQWDVPIIYQSIYELANK